MSVEALETLEFKTTTKIELLRSYRTWLRLTHKFLGTRITLIVTGTLLGTLRSYEGEALLKAIQFEMKHNFEDSN